MVWQAKRIEAAAEPAAGHRAAPVTPAPIVVRKSRRVVMLLCVYASSTASCVIAISFAPASKSSGAMLRHRLARSTLEACYRFRGCATGLHFLTPKEERF